MQNEENNNKKRDFSKNKLSSNDNSSLQKENFYLKKKLEETEKILDKYQKNSLESNEYFDLNIQNKDNKEINLNNIFNSIYNEHFINLINELSNTIKNYYKLNNQILNEKKNLFIFNEQNKNQDLIQTTFNKFNTNLDLFFKDAKLIFKKMKIYRSEKLYEIINNRNNYYILNNKNRKMSSSEKVKNSYQNNINISNKYIKNENINFAGTNFIINTDNKNNNNLNINDITSNKLYLDLKEENNQLKNKIENLTNNDY